MPNSIEYLEEAKRYYLEAQALVENPDLGAEEAERAHSLIDAANEAKSRGIALKELEGSLDAINEFAANEEKAIGRIQNHSGYKSWGQFLQDVAMEQKGNRGSELIKKYYFDEDNGAGYQSAKELSGTSGAAGGFLIPEEYQNRLQGVMGESGIIRSRATVIPMKRRTLNIPVLDQTGAGAGSPHWFGGMVAYWQDEGSSKTESSPTFRSVNLNAHKMIAFTRASDELLDDSAISLSAFLESPMGFTGVATWMEDYAFIQGDGVAKPLGFINSGAYKTVTRATSSEVNYADLINMMQGFLPSARGVWIANITVLSELMTMEGPSGNPSYLWGPNSAIAGQPSTLLGLPIIFTEKATTLGSPGDISLVDLNYYLIGDRQAITVSSTEYEAWQSDKTSWRMVHRVDGRPWLNTPITLVDGTTTVSPFVGIAA